MPNNSRFRRRRATSRLNLRLPSALLTKESEGVTMIPTFPVLGILSAMTLGKTDLPQISYVVTPIPAEDRTALEVEMTILTGDQTQSLLHLPHSSMGARNLERTISGLDVEPPAQLLDGEVPWQRVVEHGPQEELIVRYRVDWDPTQPKTTSYRPLVDSESFQFFSEHWMIRPVEEDQAAHWRFECFDEPEGWAFFGSFGVDSGSMEGPWTEVRDGFLAGGIVRGSILEVGGGRAAVMLQGPMECSDERLLRSVESVIEQQRRLLGGPVPATFVVSILEISEDVLAGVSLQNSFVCRVHGERSCDEIAELIAHEMFHQWVPGQGTVHGDYADEYQWFSEGLADYFARRFLVDSGMVDVETFVRWTNEDLVTYASNPHRHADHSEMKRAHETDFNNDYYRLNYMRGFLLALRWETHLRRAGKPSLVHALAALLDRCREQDAPLHEEDFFELFQGHGVTTVQDDVERFIDRGELLTVQPDSFGDEWEIREDPNSGAPQFHQR